MAEHVFFYITILYLGTAQLHTRKAASAYNSNARSCVGELSSICIFVWMNGNYARMIICMNMASWWATFIKFNNDPLVAGQHFKIFTNPLLGNCETPYAQSCVGLSPNATTPKLHTRNAASAYNSNAHSCVGELSKYVYVWTNENYARMIICMSMASDEQHL